MAPMKIKSGVIIYGTRPEMAIIHGIVCSVFSKYGVDCVITSGVGKKHSEKSLHYPGFAYDYRDKEIADDKRNPLMNDLRDALPCCDIIYEYKGKPQSHIHCEFDPKDDAEFQKHKMYYRKSGQWPETSP